MKPNQHTPGPWKECGCAVYQHDNWKDGKNLGGKLIVDMCPHSQLPGGDEPDEENYANARLIAAAPTLKEFAYTVSRSACLQQFLHNTCRCFACEARRILNTIEAT